MSQFFTGVIQMAAVVLHESNVFTVRRCSQVEVQLTQYFPYFVQITFTAKGGRSLTHRGEPALPSLWRLRFDPVALVLQRVLTKLIRM